MKDKIYTAEDKAFFEECLEDVKIVKSAVATPFWNLLMRYGSGDIKDATKNVMSPVKSGDKKNDLYWIQYRVCEKGKQVLRGTANGVGLILNIRTEKGLKEIKRIEEKGGE